MIGFTETRPLPLPATGSPAASRAAAATGEPAAASAKAAAPVTGAADPNARHPGPVNPTTPASPASEEVHQYEPCEKEKHGNESLELIGTRGTRGDRLVGSLDHRKDGVDPTGDSAGNVAGPEPRQNPVLDDVGTQRVGERTFKAIANLDPYFTLVGGDQEENAVVAIFLAEPPGPKKLHRETLDVVALKRGHGRHHELVRGALLMRGKLLGEG